MKKIIVSILLLAMSVSLTAKQLSSSDHQFRDDLLKKSKKQQTTGRIMLGGGAVLGTTGFFIFFLNAMPGGSDEAIAAGGTMTLIGVLSMAGSLPVFSASAKNKKKAMEISGGMNMQRTAFNTYYPVATIRVQFK